MINSCIWHRTLLNGGDDIRTIFHSFNEWDPVKDHRIPKKLAQGQTVASAELTGTAPSGFREDTGSLAFCACRRFSHPRKAHFSFLFHLPPSYSLLQTSPKRAFMVQVSSFQQERGSITALHYLSTSLSSVRKVKITQNR